MENKNPCCSTCEHYIQNNSWIDKRTKKGMLKAGKEYCEHPVVRHKIISRRALGGYNYPVWCPLAELTTCLYCGIWIRAEEGDTCKDCRKKHK